MPWSSISTTRHTLRLPRSRSFSRRSHVTTSISNSRGPAASARAWASDQRGELGVLEDRVAPTLEAVDERDRVNDDQPREPGALDRLERRGAGRDHVLEDHDLGAGRQRGALDPLVRAVALGLLADDERRARRARLEARDRGRGGERVGAERQATDGDRGRRDLVDD